MCSFCLSYRSWNVSFYVFCCYHHFWIHCWRDIDSMSDVKTIMFPEFKILYRRNFVTILFLLLHRHLFSLKLFRNRDLNCFGTNWKVISTWQSVNQTLAAENFNSRETWSKIRHFHMRFHTPLFFEDNRSLVTPCALFDNIVEIVVEIWKIIKNTSKILFQLLRFWEPLKVFGIRIFQIFSLESNKISFLFEIYR